MGYGTGSGIWPIGAKVGMVVSFGVSTQLNLSLPTVHVLITCSSGPGQKAATPVTLSLSLTMMHAVLLYYEALLEHRGHRTSRMLLKEGDIPKKHVR